MNKPGRNDPCPCGSGKKYKQCCADKNRPVPTGQKKFKATLISTPKQQDLIERTFGSAITNTSTAPPVLPQSAPIPDEPKVEEGQS